MTQPAPADERDAVRERMDADYEAPIVAEPAGGTIPPWTPLPD